MGTSFLGATNYACLTVVESEPNGAVVGGITRNVGGLAVHETLPAEIRQDRFQNPVPRARRGEVH